MKCLRWCSSHCGAPAAKAAKHSFCLSLRVFLSKKLPPFSIANRSKCRNQFNRLERSCATPFRQTIHSRKNRLNKPAHASYGVLMISREELRQLASFECGQSHEFAISFYFQPGKPQDKSHREEAILAKDLVRKTIQELQLNGRDKGAISDLEKILQLAEGL